mmetsp:Transcript_22097/g.59005  ORF Transcript_22097/g.59005 Transcript_22097/m.59005 type:complete len:217 (+) Transcript_22097:181-831(+)
MWGSNQRVGPRGVQESINRPLAIVSDDGAQDAVALSDCANLQRQHLLTPVPSHNGDVVVGVPDAHGAAEGCGVELFPDSARIRVEDGYHRGTSRRPLGNSRSLQAVQPTIVQGKPVLSWPDPNISAACFSVEISILPRHAPPQDLYGGKWHRQDGVVVANASFGTDLVDSVLDNPAIAERRPDVVLCEPNGKWRDKFLLIDWHRTIPTASTQTDQG